MSMTIMLSGSIAKQPETRTSKNGNEYTTATIRAGAGDDTMFASITAFGDLVPTLAGLAKGDQVTIIGNVKVSTYQGKDGDTKAGLSVTASRIVALVDHQSPPRQRTDRREDGQPDRKAQPAGPRGFDDDLIRLGSNQGNSFF